MKKLCRVRLINWHFFSNETIDIAGSALISGENTAGKSTVWDAIQMILTTNCKKFNTAANEKSSRDLKGYVRCKTGNVDNMYVRKGSVITYVALEFYDDKALKYFTLGVKVDSFDELSNLIIKWYIEECKLEELTFLTEGRPSFTEEFRRNDKKVLLISQVTDAKARFGRRLGNLEERFFEMIPKSLAFKPMDNVKQFIHNFILPAKPIDVAVLRNNIATLKELEKLMTITKAKIKALEIILLKNDEIVAKDREIRSNEVLLKKAEYEAKKLDCKLLDDSIVIFGRELLVEQRNADALKHTLETEQNRLLDYQLAFKENKTAKLIENTTREIEVLSRKREDSKKHLSKLQEMQTTIVNTLVFLNKKGISIVSKDDIYCLSSVEVTIESKMKIIIKLKDGITELLDIHRDGAVNAKNLLNDHKNNKINLEKDIENLKNKKMKYMVNTAALKEVIEKEFAALHIKSEVRVFSDLLEIVDPKWQNAIEGYLNTQRGDIIVEPKYFDIALNVYNKNRKTIHTVGLINTCKYDLNASVSANSLAYIVKSENRYAQAYANFLLNRVIRVDDVSMLKEHKTAITAECMVYSNHVVRKISEKVYHDPYIGALAYEIQLKNKMFEFENLETMINAAAQDLDFHRQIIEKTDVCKCEILEDNLNIPSEIMELDSRIMIEKQELHKAEVDTNFLQIQGNVEKCMISVKKIDGKYSKANNNIGKLELNLTNSKTDFADAMVLINSLERNFIELCGIDAEAAAIGTAKFEEQIKTKLPATIALNFSPMKVALDNSKNKLVIDLIKDQLLYCHDYDCDLGSGTDQMDNYISENHRLKLSEIVKYEEKLKKAKEYFELEFRESFLAKLKENIENAFAEFKVLNTALKNIYYGEDNYSFEIFHNKNKEKERLFKMITSKDNMADSNLWSGSFEEDHEEEINDLLIKLNSCDDEGEKVLEEYTDYRSYLDYDIKISKKNSIDVQYFSVIYGDKSGGETQTPYYVAIAASFAQLYKRGDTIRIIMLDEAFDKMDDDRISSMMDFFNSQKLQILVATPPAKMEIIGEKVDTILIAMRDGNESIVDVYDL